MNVSRKTWLIVVAGFMVPATLLMLPAALVAKFSDLHIGIFTSEPSILMGAPWYAGAISTLGTFLWISCATICLFSFVVLRAKGKSAAARTFLLQSGLLLLVLGLDDSFRFHEEAFVDYFGIPETVTYAAYLVATAGLVGANLRTIFKSDYLIMVLAGAFFAASLVFDIWHPLGRPSDFIEDAAKLLGISVFLAYYAIFSFNQLTRHDEEK